MTAAGYPDDTRKFEARLAGLLETFRQLNLPAEITDRCVMLCYNMYYVMLLVLCTYVTPPSSLFLRRNHRQVFVWDVCARWGVW